MATILFGLIGKSIQYSLSEQIGREYFAKHGIDADYEIFDIDNVVQIFDVIKNHGNLRGLNVTIPYKRDVIPLLSSTDDIVKDLGSVNCISIDRRTGRLHGFNTDYLAFKATFTEVLEAHHHSALVLGTGGAAAAVSYALKTMQIEHLMVSRTKIGGNIISYEMLNDGDVDFSKYNIIINATPCGTVGYDDTILSKFPFRKLVSGSLLYDLVYNPSETPFLAEGKRKHCRTINGMAMLKLQAEMFYEAILHSRNGFAG